MLMDPQQFTECQCAAVREVLDSSPTEAEGAEGCIPCGRSEQQSNADARATLPTDRVRARQRPRRARNTPTIASSSSIFMRRAAV